MSFESVFPLTFDYPHSECLYRGDVCSVMTMEEEHSRSVNIVKESTMKQK